MSAARKRARRRVPSVAAEAVIAASGVLAALDLGLRAQGYVVTGGRLHLCADGTYSARVVWRLRDAGLTISGSARGLVL